MENRGIELIAAAADLLDGNLRHDKALAARASSLLDSLATDSQSPSDKANQRALLKIGTQLKRIFQLSSDAAPGLFFFGGEIDRANLISSKQSSPTVSLAGSGLSFRDALNACLGEAAEYLSQMEHGDDEIVFGAPRTVDHGLSTESLDALLARLNFDGTNGEELDWLPGYRVFDEKPVLIPANLAIRRSMAKLPAPPAVSPGLGCAAGKTLARAVVNAACEVVERDAASLWWRGGMRARPISAEAMAEADMTQLIQNVRGDFRLVNRRTWFLDIATDLKVPVVAAISFSLEGDGFAIGLGASRHQVDAIRKALMELCQTELAYMIVEEKRRECGDDALNETDRVHLARRDGGGDGTHELLHPVGVPRRHETDDAIEAPDDMGWIRVIFEQAGIDFYVVDLTRDGLGVPVAWVCAPQLQPMPGSLMTRRLTDRLERRQSHAALPDFQLM